LWFLLTPSGAPQGTFNSLRPIVINLATGAVSIDGTGAWCTFGSTPTIPTVPISDNSGHAASTSYVNSLLNSGFPASFAGSGWTRLWNGLMIQWGSGSFSTWGQVLSFPVSFPTQCFVICSNDNGYVNDSNSLSFTVINNSQFYAYAVRTLSGPAWGGHIGGSNYQYIAIGY
jgi:hypothetical protein